MNTEQELAHSPIETRHSDGSSCGASDSRSAKGPATEASPWFSSKTSPLGWRDIVAIAMLVALCDLTIYRGNGFAGLALLLITAPILLWLASSRVRKDRSVWITGLMLAVLAARVLWCGNELQVAVGFMLLVAFSMALSGLRPYLLDLVVFASQTIAAGCASFMTFGRSLSRFRAAAPRGIWLNIVLPAVTLVVFGMIFMLANPDLLAAFGQGIERILFTIREWIVDFAPRPLQVVFWACVAWIAVGLLRPVVVRSMMNETDEDMSARTNQTSPSSVYPAMRNTLVTVIALFAVYLAFEFKTLWFREFPEGFYYAGYAHQGAAWLTVALALATVVLSLVFRGSILKDHRLRFLRRLAWIWSAESFVLAIAVYNRLSIYVGFNGLTRMRLVGYFGMTAVVIGFVLVLIKIANNHSFVWLIRRQLWTVAFTLYAYSLTPADTIAVRYNVHRVLDGDPAPAVQISVQPISAEGIVQLKPLLDAPDETIREGVRALLAQRHEQAESLATRREEQGWTAVQVAEQLVLRKLRESKNAWEVYKDPEEREAAISKFRQYVHQWY